MKINRKLLAMMLSFAMVLSMAPVPASALSPAPSASGNVAEHWFYDQLSSRGKAIYDALWDMFDSGVMKDGKGSYDLVDNGVVGGSEVAAYLAGDRTLFRDFAAAKDAFDLEHPEAWYVDSSYLSFRVTQDSSGAYHAYMGSGRSDDYYVYGVAGESDVEARSAALDNAIAVIVSGARNKNTDAEKVKYVHEQITKGISYRYETECAPSNVGFVRTAYGLVTHEGVCEAYARSLQMALNELDIPCVLIHGLQTSGTPEQHMWNAVQVGGKWYVVDATFDDPVVLDIYGKVRQSDNGLDGGERETYLLAGGDVTMAYWKPSGYVSSSETAFEYPEIEWNSYGSGKVEAGKLSVEYVKGEMEDTASTEYHVSFDGMGLAEAARQGYHFLVRMYDVNADGSVDGFEDWYYPVHSLLSFADKKEYDEIDWEEDIKGGSPYFHDADGYLYYNISNCEYVEFAVTTKAPPEWSVFMDLIDLGGYYSGNGSDIVAQSGLIYNENGSYEQPPYVKNVSPQFNSPVYVGPTYTIHMEFTDPLYHPDQASIDGAVEGKVNDAGTAMDQVVRLYYTGTTYSWGVNGGQTHVFADKPVPQNVRWTCGTHPEGHVGTEDSNGDIVMSGIGADCRLMTLEFEFSASKQWSDDSIQYNFHLDGLVGVKSNKFVVDGGWSYVFENESAFCAYRCYTKGGIDWNLWGQPQLLDSDIDLGRMVAEGVDGKQETLAQLQSQMHLDDYDMNGRLMLVVESVNGESARGEQLEDALDGIGVDLDAAWSSDLYEIDFARICGKTIVETGDSLRMSVGFPGGITDPTGLVFKVYHFVKDDAGNIIRVEELPVTVTPYGLVFLCDSFSPFAVVAFDADGIGEEPGTEKTVMAMAGEGGAILLANGTSASGKNGIVSLSEGQHVVLTIRPDNGKTISTVMFDGHEIPVSGDGTVVVAYGDIGSTSCVLSASFVSEAVRQADEDAGMTPVVADMGNDNSSEVPDRLVEEPGVAPEDSVEVGGSDDSGSVDNAGDNDNASDNGNAGNTGSTDGTGNTGNNGGSASSGTGVSSPSTSGGVTTVKVTAGASVSGTKASASVSSYDMGRAVSSVVSEAARRGTNPVVEVQISSVSGRASSLNVTLPVDPLKTLAKADGASLAIVSDIGEARLDSAALVSLAEQASGSTVILSVAPAAFQDLNAAQSKAVGDGCTVLDLSVSSNGIVIHDFGGGAVTITLPYALKSGESGADIVAYYMDDTGRLDACATGYANGKVTFVAAHLGLYVIGTSALDPAAPEEPAIVNPFADVAEGSYYYDAVMWAITNGVTYGTDSTHFSPSTGCTRAQFVTFLWRAAGSPEPSGSAGLFSDVSRSSHGPYYDAILWAVERGVTYGTGNGMFSPDLTVTRAQSVTFMYRFAEQAGMISRYGIPDFADVPDNTSMNPYYNAIGWAQADGITGGIGNGLFGPFDACDRGMMITFLYRLFTDASV